MFWENIGIVYLRKQMKRVFVEFVNLTMSFWSSKIEYLSVYYFSFALDFQWLFC